MNGSDKSFVVRALQACVENSNHILNRDITECECEDFEELADLASTDTKARLQTALSILKKAHWFK